MILSLFFVFGKHLALFYGFYKKFLKKIITIRESSSLSNIYFRYQKSLPSDNCIDKNGNTFIVIRGDNMVQVSLSSLFKKEYIYVYWP